MHKDLLVSQEPVFLTTRGHQFATFPCMRVAVDNAFSGAMYDYYALGLLWYAGERRTLLMYGDLFEVKCPHKKRCSRTTDGQYVCAGFVVATSNSKPYVLCYSVEQQAGPDDLPLYLDVACLASSSPAENNEQRTKGEGSNYLMGLKEEAGIHWFPFRSYYGIGDDVLPAVSLGYLVKGLLVCDVNNAMKYAKDINIPMLLIGNTAIPAHTPFVSPVILCSEQVTSGKMELEEGMDAWCQDQQFADLYTLLQTPRVSGHGKKSPSAPRCLLMFDSTNTRAVAVAMCVMGIFGMSVPAKVMAEAERAVAIAHIVTTRYAMYPTFQCCDATDVGAYIATSSVVGGLLEQQMAAEKRGALREIAVKPTRLADEALPEVSASL